jgi:thiol-disulfide isomerase/thioredoxin
MSDDPTTASSVCSTCGTALQDEAKFCSECGAETGAGSDDARESTDFALAGEESARSGPPRWVPAAIAITLFAGIGGGLLIGLLTGGDDAAATPDSSPTTAATTETTTTTTVLAGGSETETTAAAIAMPIEVGTPSVTGSALPRLTDAGTDPALGLPAPEVEGTDPSGTAVTISNDGRAKVILFVAHWCPYCQAEIPEVREWIAAGGLPEDVDLYSVSTDVRATADNYPPSAWFERELWTAPLVVDDAAGTVARSFGLPGYPFWVFVSADGIVVDRASGGLPVDALAAAATALAAGTSPPPPTTTEAPIDTAAYGTVTVTGDDLPLQAQDAPDGAIGTPVPVIEGIAPDGTAVTIGDDGRAKIVMVVAHWCPYCQEEVPTVRDWLATGPLGDAVDFYTVATFTDATRPNYPPTDWLEGEALDTPTVFDDPGSAVARAYGVPAVPYWVLIADDGTLALRGSGALPAEALDSLVDFLVNGPPDGS